MATMRRKVLVTKIEPTFKDGNLPTRGEQCEWAYCVNRARYYVRSVDQYYEKQEAKGAAIV
jgi:hypothetical protein